MSDVVLLIADECGVAVWRRPQDSLALASHTIGGLHRFDSVEHAMRHISGCGFSLRPQGAYDELATWEVLEPVKSG